MRGRSETVTVTGVAATFVTYRFVLKKVSLFPRANEACVTITSSAEGAGFPAGWKRPSPVASSIRIAKGTTRPPTLVTVKSTRKLAVAPSP